MFTAESATIVATITISDGDPLAVVNTNDSGPGSFRQAILNANANADLSTITFAIPGAGVHTIEPTTPLPTVTATAIINGTTQPGFAGAPLIELSGALAGAGQNGLSLAAANSVVRGLVINRWQALGVIVIGSATGAVIEGNYIGVDSTATVALGNVSGGISVFAPNVRIGGVSAGNSNVIAGNGSAGQAFFGIFLGPGANGALVLGNFIGTNSAGAAGLGNFGHGITMQNMSNAVIGSTGVGRNVISGNTQQGINLQAVAPQSADNNQIVGNYIGVTPAGTAARPNTLNGIFIGNFGTVTNTLINANVISGNSANGISASNGGTMTITGNFIGTNAAGTAAIPNVTSGINFNSTSNAVIGGVGGAARNVISGNTGAGVIIQAGSGIQAGVNSTGNIVQGNYIGTNATGTAALANGGGGVSLSVTGAVTNSNNAIGTAGSGNLISGNVGSGVWVQSGVSGTAIQGNFIGTNAAGTAAIANSAIGIRLSGGGTAVGGITANAGNVISGNGVDGIALESSGHSVQGNLIGTNAGGTAAIPNLFQGVFMEDGTTNNVVGGTNPAARNVISGNGIDGVQIGRPGGTATNNNQVLGNFIGTNAAGTNAIPNGFSGVTVHDGTGNIIGGTAAGEGNLIAFNTNSGVLVIDSGVAGSTVNNRIRGNQIFSNGLLGIDLGLGAGADGVTANDAGDADTGPNNRQNFPVVTQATPGVTTIQGTLNSLANTAFALDFYASASCDPSGNGEGQRYLGTFSANTNGSGNLAFSSNVASAPQAGEFSKTGSRVVKQDITYCCLAAQRAPTPYADP